VLARGSLYFEVLSRRSLKRLRARGSLATLSIGQMAVNYRPPSPEELLPVPGVALGTAAAGIKNWSRDDLLLVRLAPGARAAGVFTQNRFCAAPVMVCREHLVRAESIGALVVNAGNANAGTGDQGLADARATCAAAAELVGCKAEAVLPFSTGVIMEPLPLDSLSRRLSRNRMVCGSPGDHDHRYRTQRRFPADQHRRCDGHSHRDREGSRHDLAQHGYTARLRRHRRADGSQAAR
jgi:hypothetical protein